MYAKKNDMTIVQIRLIRRLLAQGNSLSDSIKKFGEFKTVSCELSFNKEQLKIMEKEWKTKNTKELICMIMEGKMRGTPELLKIM